MAKEARSLGEELEESRIIVVSGYVNSDKAASIIFQMMDYNAKSEKEDIQLFIGSGGGSYLDMMAIIDTMNTIKAPISGTCVGMADGYSALLLACCAKGKRYALRHSQISFEQPYGMLQSGANQETEIAIEAKEVKLEREIFENMLAQKTNTDFDKIHRDCEVGVSLSAQQALEYGIVDEILE